MRFRMGRRWRGGRGRGSAKGMGLAAAAETDSAARSSRTLAGVEPGREVSVVGYLPMPGFQRRHLQAYGLLPGRRVLVLAQRPVTIVQVEQTELAFEISVAANVLVGD